MKEEDKACYKRGGEPAQLPPNEQRQAKLDGYRREKELEQQIHEVMEQQKDKLKQGKNLDDEEDEEDGTRKYLLMLLEQCIRKSLDHLRFSKQEIQMLVCFILMSFCGPLYRFLFSFVARNTESG